MNIEGKEVYSTEEKQVGYWIDDKPLYQKTIEFGALPNNGTKRVNHNIANLDMVTSMKATAYHSATPTYINLPHVDPTSAAAQVYITVRTDDINVVTKMDRSGYTRTYVTLQYTKTTD